MKRNSKRMKSTFLLSLFLFILSFQRGSCFQCSIDNVTTVNGWDIISFLIIHFISFIFFSYHIPLISIFTCPLHPFFRFLHFPSLPSPLTLPPSPFPPSPSLSPRFALSLSLFDHTHICLKGPSHLFSIQLSETNGSLFVFGGQTLTLFSTLPNFTLVCFIFIFIFDYFFNVCLDFVYKMGYSLYKFARHPE
jgi:hypothetical protein